MIEIETIEEFEAFLKSGKTWDNAAVQDLELTRFSKQLLKCNFTGSVFLGCKLGETAVHRIIKTGGLFFPGVENLPYKPFRGALYTRDTLFDGFDLRNPDSLKETTDWKIYEHYLKTGKYNPDSILETLTRRLHDHAISDALYDFLERVRVHSRLGTPDAHLTIEKSAHESKISTNNNIADKRYIVAIMGGHSLSRDSQDFKKAARISRLLARSGYLMISGGGPGAMEATHLGTYLAGYEEKDLDKAIKIIARAPLYDDPLWLTTAYEVIETFPPRPYRGGEIESIAIPTWLYGHEPTTPFATKIAKYFANSVREEGLLAIAEGGVIFTPGSAGTIQEIFQDACQNHYESFGAASPMAFLNEEYWREEKPVYPLLTQLAEGRDYAGLISISDDVETIVNAIKDFRQ